MMEKNNSEFMLKTYGNGALAITHSIPGVLNTTVSMENTTLVDETPLTSDEVEAIGPNLMEDAVKLAEDQLPIQMEPEGLQQRVAPSPHSSKLKGLGEADGKGVAVGKGKA